MDTQSSRFIMMEISSIHPDMSTGAESRSSMSGSEEQNTHSVVKEREHKSCGGPARWRNSERTAPDCCLKVFILTSRAFLVSFTC